VEGKEKERKGKGANFAAPGMIACRCLCAYGNINFNAFKNEYRP
jgi:hypothetical protein